MDAQLWIPAVALGLLALALALTPTGIAAWREHRQSRRRRAWRSRLRMGRAATPDEIAAEARAEELMGSVIGEDGLEAYRVLGFLHAFGDAEDDGQPGYGYLLYPHRPIVSFDARSGALLNELCVSFPDHDSQGHGSRLPDADDVLAKWMAIRGDELGLLAEANIHPPGRQVDPQQARRDIVRLAEWTASPSDGLATTQ